jgi:uncharacterized membrane protein YhaH (DUF805 family)
MSSQFPGDQPADPTPPPPSWTPAASAPDPAAATVPSAGWYADPAGSGQLRYWDGAAWTDHLSAVPAAAPLYGSAPAYAAAGYAGYAPQPRSVGFGDAVRLAFRNWKDFESRSTRSEFWWFYLFQMLVAFGVYLVFFVILAIVAGISGGTSSSGSTGTVSSGGGAAVAIVGILLTVALVAFAVVFFVVGLALTVRRLHDTSRSGWWYLIALVPFGSIVLIVFLATESSPGPNQYGPYPV